MRYVGTKRKLAKGILPYIQKALAALPNAKYIEPFVGGCNMIDQVKHHTRIGCDANPHLIALLKTAQSNPEKLLEVECLSRSAYKYLKSNKEPYLDWYVGLMGFMPTFNNQWFHSFHEDLKPGRFSASIRSLINQDLSGIKLINCDYQKIPIEKRNVIYCDIPYRIEDYYKMLFNHDEFYEWARFASKDNIVLISEYEMPEDFTCIWQKVVKPRINAIARNKVEKLFIYKH